MNIVTTLRRYVRNRVVLALRWWPGYPGAQAALAARAALQGLPPPKPTPEAQIGRAALLGRHLTLPPRVLTHLCIAVLVLAALIAVRPPAPTATTTLRVLTYRDQQLVVAYAPVHISPGELLLTTQALVRPAAPAYEYHTLREGETLGEIAARYGVSAETLYWTNGLDRTNFLAAGQELRVPRVSGVPHVVAAGETATGIAATYGAPANAIMLFRPNGVRGEHLTPGREIFVPGGTRALPEATNPAELRAVVAGAVREGETNLRGGPGRAYDRVAELSGGFLLRPLARHADWVRVEAGEHGAGWVRADLIWLPPGAFEALPETSDFPPPPVRWVWPAYGELSSPFGWRRVPFRSFHNGLDIANRAGTPIRAARAGRVTEAGWCSGYGYCVKIDHGNGVASVYGHLLKKPVVRRGDQVEAGDRIGSMGSSYDRAGGGYSTGVHLHFTVTVNGRPVNPMRFLP
jgi:murein DD-endopeptidase MepM/ murein hydrolase activator NlpD